MAAAGARGDLVGRDAAAGPALSVEAAGLYATTTSAAGEAGTLAITLSGRISLWHEASGLRHGDVSASLRLTTSW